MIPLLATEVVGQGLVTDKDTFVWAAYAVTWFMLGGYTVSLWWRNRALTPKSGGR